MARIWVGVIAVVGLLVGNLAEVNAALTTNSWAVNSGKWEIGDNWDHGVPTLPDSLNFIGKIAPALGRTITIDSTTVASNGINGCMVISNLTLRGSTLSPQTLLITNASLTAPLKVVDTLTIDIHASVIISNAALQVGRMGGGTVSDDGGLTLLGGTIIATNFGIGFAVGDTGAGRMTVLGGTWRASGVYVGKLAGS